MLEISLTEPIATDPAQAGGKGANLARCLQAGFDVPPGWVLTAKAYRDFVGGVLDDLRMDAEDPAALGLQCQAVRERLLDHPLPAGQVDMLEKLDIQFPVAVRSSSTMEDLAGAAFAGQHDTFLNVTGHAALVDAVRRCFTSLWEDRAVQYRQQHGFAHAQASMAVVIQQMVQPDAAGVAFCMHPITGDLGQVMINAAPGLGESVVAGDGAVDQYVVQKADGVVVDAQVETDADVPIAQLVKLCRDVEWHYGFPQDIEWACRDGRVYLLQSRPITTFPARWTREESAERFPSPITPLTWDYTVDGFHESLAYSLDLLGMPAFEGRWFDRFDGYIYGNETAVRLFASGQQVGFNCFDELRAMIPTLRSKYGWVHQLPADWARNLDGYLIELGRLGAIELDTLTDERLWQHLEQIDALGKAYFRPNIAISLTQGILHRALYRLVVLVFGVDEAAGVYDQLAAYCETKTAQVARDLMRLLDLARDEPGLAQRLGAGDLADLSLAGYPRFEAQFHRFLSQHGHREVEYDPYHPTWGQRPVLVLENLRLMLSGGTGTDAAGRERELRLSQQAAEQRLLQALPSDLRFFGSELVRLARAYTSLDDLEHYQTTRLNPLFRSGLLEAGRRLGLAQPSDVFFLRREGLEAWLLRGETSMEVLRANRAAFQDQHGVDPPWVYGQTVEPEYGPCESVLRGSPGSPGSAEGEVCVVHCVDDFSRFKPGAVLVARTTNPSWTPLFYSAAAVITESGGPLSHGAVTAREVGLPAVMAVRGVMGRLKDGDRVRVDGGQGVVQVLGRDSVAPGKAALVSTDAG